MSAHSPVRPSWVCSGCGLDWPCPARRPALLAQYSGSVVSLGLYLARFMIDAMQDLGEVPAGQLYGRFLGWLPPAVAVRRPVQVRHPDRRR